MLKIRILGIKDIKLRNMYRKATMYMVDSLCNSRMNLSLLVQFEPISSEYGLCHYITSRKFKLSIDNSKSTKIYKQLQTIAHEVTHAKQFAKNELMDYTDKTTRWKTKYYSFSHPYKKCPWEKEAFKNEILADKFINENKIKIEDYEILRFKE